MDKKRCAIYALFHEITLIRNCKRCDDGLWVILIISAHTHPFQWGHSTFLDVMWYGDDTGILIFLCSEDFFFLPVKRWDHSNRELLLYSNMFYLRDDIMLLEDITSLFNEGHVRQRPGWAQRLCGFEEKKKTQQNFMFKSLKMQFSSLCFWWFSLLLWTRNLIAHTVSTHTPTHSNTSTHISSHQFWAFHMDRHIVNTHAQLPLWNPSLCSLKVLKMFSASSPPVCTSSPCILPSSHL